jgi:hypothetical protein
VNPVVAALRGLPDALKLPRFVTSIVGPGDPVWHGKPDRDRARRIWTITTGDSRGRQFYYAAGGLRALKSPADYAHLNRLLDAGLG